MLGVQGNLGLELEVKGIQWVHQFHKRIGFPTIYGDPEEFRIRIEGQGVGPTGNGFPIIYGDPEEFRIRIEGQGDSV